MAVHLIITKSTSWCRRVRSEIRTWFGISGGWRRRCVRNWTRRTGHGILGAQDRIAALPIVGPLLTDADLYEEDGLPRW